MPDILAVRRKIYQDRDRCVMKEGRAFESEWTKDLPKRTTTLDMSSYQTGVYMVRVTTENGESVKLVSKQ